jgi:hypothetical protein
MPTYFRFGIGPFRVSQRLGRTKAQKRAAAKARAQRQYAGQQAREKADRDSRSFKDVPARDVTRGEGGFVSFTLDPPGFPQLVVRLEDGIFRASSGILTHDFTGLHEGDRVSGMLGRDGRSLDWLSVSLEDRMRYTYAGWAEDIRRQPDGSTTFRVIFPANPQRVWHSEGREPLTVSLQPGEKVRWKDGRPYGMREGSSLTVVFDPDGGPPKVYHEKYD